MGEGIAVGVPTSVSAGEGAPLQWRTRKMRK